MKAYLVLLGVFFMSSVYSESRDVKRCYHRIRAERMRVVKLLRKTSKKYRRRYHIPMTAVARYFYYQGKNEGLHMATNILKKRRIRNELPFHLKDELSKLTMTLKGDVQRD